MSVRITSAEDKVALFCSTTDQAFGPVFDSESDAKEFLDWLERRGDPRDPRSIHADGELVALCDEWFKATGRAE